MARVKRVAPVETHDSMACVNASNPLSRVTANGSPNVSSGSTTAAFGIINGDRNDFFTLF